MCEGQRLVNTFVGKKRHFLKWTLLVMLWTINCCMGGGTPSNGATPPVSRTVRLVLQGRKGLGEAMKRVDRWVPARLDYAEFRGLLEEALVPRSKADGKSGDKTIQPARYLQAEEVKRLGEDAENPYSYRLVLPENYSPERPYPLVVGLHGKMGKGEQDFFWMRWCVKLGRARNQAIMIVSRGERSGFHSRAGIVAAVRKTLRETSAHPGAVLLLCHSASGGANLKLLQHWPELFAADYIHASIVPPRRIVRRVPLYLACGRRDEQFFADMREAANELQGWHPDIRWDPIADQGHHFESAYFADEVFPWMLKRVPDMDPFRRRFSVEGGTVFTPGKSFVRVGARSGYSLRGRVENNSLTLTARPEKSIERILVYITDRVFDTDKKLKISVNGQAYQMVVQPPKASVALESAAHYRDPEKICGRRWIWTP